MRAEQYGVYLKVSNPITKEAEFMIYVYYKLNEAVDMENKFKSLDSIPQRENYKVELSKLVVESKVKIFGVLDTNITEENDRVYYSDNCIGKLKLLNRTPILIEGIE